MRVLITGAAKRIGAAIARAFARAGHDVVIHYNKSEKEAEALLAELASRASGGCHASVQADLTRQDAASALFDQVLADGAELDVLVNNASSYRRGTLGDEDEATLERDFAVNFTAPYGLMAEYRRRCRRGQVINILDYRVGLPDPKSGTYGLAKKALKDATEALAVAWAPHFRVNGIAPGIVMPADGVPWQRMERLVARIPVGHRTTEDEVAAAAVFIAGMPSMTGEIMYLDGGLHLLGADALGEATGRKDAADSAERQGGR